MAPTKSKTEEEELVLPTMDSADVANVKLSEGSSSTNVIPIKSPPLEQLDSKVPPNRPPPPPIPESKQHQPVTSSSPRPPAATGARANLLGQINSRRID